ncbi:hypothetical protein [Aporhodopirellula aestuarii]|uniref:hypothetical protein n=1 Tax=Aporhodopirellula aestuarii TaxID=2950107 RepID=UPI00203369FC|nr:hypothetical protein [Aporhodopirellula aestuarii]
MGALVACVLLGCQTTAPINLWQPPQLASLSGESLVLMEIAGPTDIATGLRDELLAQSKPIAQKTPTQTVPENTVTFLLPEQIADESTIRLVSGFENEPSDLAIAAAARRSGVRYLMRGEIMHATGNSHSGERLSVVWKLVGLDADSPTEGMPITISQEQIAQKYPDLMQVIDPHTRLQKAMVRETLSLINQSVTRKTAILSEPRYTLGSAAVREGNLLAQQGKWPAAEKVWVLTLERYPAQVGAWINAAIAAAARQDFAQAKQRITRAIQLSAFSPANRSLAKETLVWLELQQRDYHETFGLPDPAEGWRVTHGDETSLENSTLANSTIVSAASTSSTPANFTPNR